MATWITDRTQADVDRVKELTAKARSGTWTEEEQQEATPITTALKTA